jgi:alkanesulfonate monooxygenase SsuD/methylene tetrahydromethanopterin reductase-like flavin-dependent oxidoreductase (luciferase family)
MKFRIFTEPQQGADYQTLRNVAAATEELGFDAFFRSDHYLKMGDVSGLPGPTDAWTTLAGLAVETSRIRLGTLMSAATFRLPGPLAITVAQVDQMSGGRVEFGLGAGWFEAEHTAYGIPFPSLGERFDILEEQLAVITGLWGTAEGETFSRSAAAPAGPAWRCGCPPHAPACGPVRGRVQRAVPVGAGFGRRVRARPRGLRGGRALPGDHDLLGRAHGVLRKGRSRVPPPGRRDRP